MVIVDISSRSECHSLSLGWDVSTTGPMALGDHVVQQTPISLLERLRRPGEKAAWDRFVELYTLLLYHWARSLGLQDPDAADLVQDVFATLVQKMPGFVYDPQKGFRNWLRAVTQNRWRDNRKMRSNKRSLAGETAALDGMPGPDGEASFWETEYHRHLVGRALDVMKAEFRPTTWRDCWELVVEGRPASAVAAELGMSENAVYIAKGRVLRRLRQELVGLLD